ncbi:MAG: 2-succinyl-6-hydroxy-2,4-cyclohexadiene-1-carboxylate synthase [Candidatus Hydrogenedentes bacterium]|nr:2-succinyl-6-hydroxy-2,4-cyclohexadiene-1-carboxylate synthase [Candidatus Hydrogenedentota bacterium]
MQLTHSIHGGQRAPLVVFLHGFLGSRADWREATETLRGAYRCLAVDLPGHGGSVGGGDDDYTMQAAATAVIDLIDTCDAASFSLVGYSMGGRLALYLASIYAMRIDAMVIESASPGLRSQAERGERRAADERWAAMLEDRGMAAFLDAWYEQPLFASLAARPELLAHIKAGRMRNDPRELARALHGMSVGNQPPMWDEWQGNHIPSLVVAGESDSKYCAVAREMVGACGAAKIAIVSGAGHNVHEEAPDEYNDLIYAFLKAALK